MAIKLVIADIDGTLVTRSKTLTAKTCEAVDRLRAHGIRFTLTSGRPPRGMAAMIAPLKITAPVAAFNGGVYVMPDLRTVLSQRTLPPDVARGVVDYLLQEGLDVWVYQGSDWYLRDPGAFRVAKERSNVGFEPVVIEDLHRVLEAPIKIVGVSEDLSRVARCESELGMRLGADASAARSTKYYLDVTHPEANKGMVVREAARLLRIPLEEVAAIGDMLNDVPMLKDAGLGIAMGNAGAEVQRVARHVTRSNEEEGFAHAVDTFILGAPPVARTPLGLPPRVRACLFGLEGVLTQTANLHARAWKGLLDRSLREHARASGQPFLPFDLVRDFSLYLDRRPPAEGLRAFLASRGIELLDHTVRALTERQGEAFVELLRQERAEAYEDSVRYVEEARAAGLRTVVVSSDAWCAQTLESAGIADLFDAKIEGVLSAADTPEGMVTSDVYLDAARAVGVDPEHAAVFEDELAGVAAARVNHFAWVVGVDRLGRADALRAHGADTVVTDLIELVSPEGAAAGETGEESAPELTPRAGLSEAELSTHP